MIFRTKWLYTLSENIFSSPTKSILSFWTHFSLSVVSPIHTKCTKYYSLIIVLTMSPTVNFRDHDGRITMSKHSVWSPFTVNDWICVREFKIYFAATSHHFLEPLVHKFIIASGCHYFSYWRPNNKYWCPKFKWTSKNNSILRTLRHLVFCTKELAMEVKVAAA